MPDWDRADPDEGYGDDTLRPPTKSLSQMADEVYQFEVAKGWQPNDNRFFESLMLLVTEVSEAADAYREIGFGIRTRPSKCDHVLDCDCLGKPDDVPSELADVFIRLLSTWHQFMEPLGLSLEVEFERKMTYNMTRAHRHGGKRL